MSAKSLESMSYEELEAQLQTCDVCATIGLSRKGKTYTAISAIALFAGIIILYYASSVAEVAGIVAIAAIGTGLSSMSVVFLVLRTRELQPEVPELARAEMPSGEEEAAPKPEEGQKET